MSTEAGNPENPTQSTSSTQPDVSAQRTKTPYVDHDRLRAAQRSDDFVELKKRFRGFVFPMTLVFLGWYLLYVVASGWARDFMGQKLFGNINVAYVFGLLQFVSTFLIAWLYERHMAKNVDPVAARVRTELEGVDVR